MSGCVPLPPTLDGISFSFRFIQLPLFSFLSGFFGSVGTRGKFDGCDCDERVGI